MKKQAFAVALVLALTSAFSAHAVTFEVLDAQGNPLLQVEKNADLQKSVGALTMDVLRDAQSFGVLKFKGDEDGLVSINDLGNETKVVSSTEVKAYGWCFSLNGVTPSTPADETSFLSNQDKLVWYYGYAHYLNGQWEMGCTPAWK